MKKTLVIALALASVALAATSSLTLILNGKISSDKAISVNGKTYVPLSALSSLGIKVSSGSGAVSLTSGPTTSTPAGNSGSSGSGGANQKNSVEGCLNEFLFNGVWRLRVKALEVITDPNRGDFPGYAVTVELRNGTPKTLTPVEGGIDANNAFTLNFADGNSLAYSYGTDWVDKAFAKIVQGSGTVFTFKIYPEAKLTLEQAKANLPQKFLFEVNPDKLKKDLGVGFTVKDPSFRVDLTCKK